MARKNNKPVKNNRAEEHDIATTDEWQIYVDLFADTTEDDDAPVLVPLFPCDGFVPGNVGKIPASAARALAGIGTPDEVARARAFMLEHRAKVCH
jgi:hypothetical protein